MLLRIIPKIVRYKVLHVRVIACLVERSSDGRFIAVIQTNGESLPANFPLTGILAVDPKSQGISA